MAWPTTNDPRTEFATLRMTMTEAADLDALAKRRGLSRSAAVRDAVANEISRDKRAQKKAQRKKAGDS